MPKKSTASRSKKVRSDSSSKKPVAQTVFQLKVTLKGYKPLIWRRIQIEDCTLDELHEHIQTAMGWTNSHLHHFHIARQPYGDRELMQENFEEFGYKDSTGTKLSDIMPADGKRLKFSYEYDFGDSWDHEIVVEKATEPELGKKYPVCLAGERACPPEDCGGVWGYADLLEVIGNKDHENHEELLEWLGGSFNPEAFEPIAATREMRKGLPAWR